MSITKRIASDKLSNDRNGPGGWRGRGRPARRAPSRLPAGASRPPTPLYALALPVLLGCAGCVSTDRLAGEEAAVPVFDPVAFFVGRTHGTGTLRIASHRRQRTLVEGSGRIDPAGAVVLDQTVSRGDRPATHRTWRIAAAGEGRYVGTLSDATGPVTGVVEGNRLHLSFRIGGGLRVDQWMWLQPGGRQASNVLLIHKLGLPVARLDEVIAREP